MQRIDTTPGLDELVKARRESRSLYWAVGLFSVFVNLLMLTGPLYMLQVYDRVLGSRSVETLIALSLLVAFLYGIMGLLDYTRGRVMARVGARFQSRMDRRVFSAVMRRAATGRQDGTSTTGLQDLESVQRFLISPSLTSLFDAPWTPMFLLGITIFHPWLGALAIGGGALLVVFALANQWLSIEPLNRASTAVVQSELVGQQLRAEAEMVQSLGMQQAAFDRWKSLRNAALGQTITSSDISGQFTSLTKAFRLFLQSAMLGLGAYLVLQNQLTPGAMIASSILLGRALAPIETLINQWAVVQRARTGWGNLAELLSEVPPEAPRTALPRPKARLDVQQITVIPPHQQQAALRLVSFKLMPGQALGVIGPSGAGKSTLAKALTGVWRAAGGKIRLDGAALEQYDPDVLGRHIGYLPQRVQLFDGTIAENIARLDPTPDAAKVVEAAKRAAAHEMILKLANGYDTPVRTAGERLSGGQLQRIGLARALFDDPVLLVLDEPNSNLDNEGNEALNTAIRQTKAAGGAVLIMAHRPAAIAECDHLLVLEGGACAAFGPKNEVLRDTVKNHEQIKAARTPGGVR